MNRKISVGWAALIFSLTGLPVWAKSRDFIELMQTLSCANEVRAQLSAKLQRQTWVPTAFSWPDLPLAEGIVFQRRDSRIAPRKRRATYQVIIAGSSCRFVWWTMSVSWSRRVTCCGTVGSYFTQPLSSGEALRKL
jgi:hypothetical protein